MIQKILKVGNSAALTIPSEFMKAAGWKTGDEVEVESNPRLMIYMVTQKHSTYRGSIASLFLGWLESFMLEYRPILEKLKKY